jgi:hypothetical protein
MDYIEIIKNSFKIVLKNWQLTAIQFCAMIAIVVGFLIFVGIPFAIAYIAFGVDLTELTKITTMFYTMENLLDLVSKYFWIIVIFIASVSLYLLIVTVLWVYVLGGSAGVLGKAVKDGILKFSMAMFFSEAKRLFWPITWFASIICLIFTALIVIIALLIIVIVFATGMTENSGTPMFFVGILLTLLTAALGFIMIHCTMVITLYGLAEIALKDSKAVASTINATKYIYRKPGVLVFCFILLLAYIAVTFILNFAGLPFSLIPFIGIIIGIPYQLFTYAVVLFLQLVINTAVFIQYYSTEIEPSCKKEPVSFGGNSA